MADRQDIDALLIGALYGELDGDERARLEAHLASHPQDRSALDGLRSTRQLLRDADLPVAMAVEEPSPAITAMLLQEAARRAPAPAARGGFLAFLAGLLKPFAASPALSAAAALVLVGGAAGLMYSRGTFRASEPSVGGGDRLAQVEQAEAKAEAKLDKLEENLGVAAGQGAPAPAGAPTTPDPSADSLAAAAVDDYRVGLADGDDAVVGADRGLADDVGNERERAGALKGKRGSTTGSATAFQASGPASTATATPKLDGAQRPGYLAVDKSSKDEAGVLTLDGTRYETAAESQDRFAGEAEKNVAKKAPERVALAEGRSAGNAPAAAPPPPPVAGASQGAGGGGSVAATGAAPQKPIAGKAPASRVQQQVARDQGAAKSGSKAYDPVKAAQLDAWARDQHARMVKLVAAGKCVEAGPIGADIARKNPDYYQANVANDRAVRACRPYVDRARRAKSEDAKTKAAAPRANAPDSPFEADMESVK